jgi:hypothetical protein
MRNHAILYCLLLTTTGCSAPFIGGSGVVAGIPEPYASTCVDDDLVGGIGLQAFGGATISPSLAILGRFTTLSEVDHAVCETVPRDEPDGIHRFRRYESEMFGQGLRTLDVQLRFSPPAARAITLSAGGGFETDHSRPFAIAGIGAQIGRRVQFTLGAEMIALYTPYIITEEEWQNSQIIRATQVDEGEEWKHGFLFRAGAQIPIGIR